MKNLTDFDEILLWILCLKQEIYF